MNRAQFMEELEKLLSDIPYSERREALDYYESYFDDAGEENEAAVIRELGSPGKVAAIIKADLNENSDPYREESQRDGEQVMDRSQRGYRPRERRSNARFILVLILVIFLSPFLAGAIGGAAGVLLTILLLPFLLVFGLGLGVLALMVGAVVCAAAGVSSMVSSPAVGLLVLGIALVMAAVGILILLLLIWLTAKCLPVLLRKITDGLGRIMRRERKDGVDA